MPPEIKHKSCSECGRVAGLHNKGCQFWTIESDWPLYVSIPESRYKELLDLEERVKRGMG